jgi:hypothetical protein
MYLRIIRGDTSPSNSVYAGSAIVPVPPVLEVASLAPVAPATRGAAAPVGPAAGFPVDPAALPTPLAAEGDTPLIYKTTRKSIGIHFTTNNKMTTEIVTVPDVIVDTSSLFSSFDPKNPVPTILAVYAHFQTLPGMTEKDRVTLLQGVLSHLVDTSTLGDDEKVQAKTLVSTLVPHIVDAAMQVTSGKVLLKKIEDAAPKVLELVAEVVPSKWCVSFTKNK